MQLYKERTKITKNFDDKNAFRVPEFLRFDPFSRILFSLRAKGTFRKDKRASVVSIFRYSDSVTGIRFLPPYLPIFIHLTLSYHFIVIKLFYFMITGRTNTKRVLIYTRSLRRKKRRLAAYLMKKRSLIGMLWIFIIN